VIGGGLGQVPVRSLLALTVVLSAPAAAETVPLPQARPAAPALQHKGTDDLAEDPPLPKARPAEIPAPAQQVRREPVPQPLDAEAEIACRSRLAALGVDFEELEPIDGEGACGAAAPVSVSGLGDGIGLTPPATLNCRMAESLARWVQEAVVPAAERHLEVAPTSLLNAASYVCRSRNNRPGARLSEHATANAIDIGGIMFEEGEAVAVRARGDDEARRRAFQRAIRRGACEHFTTVIGPGTDAAHADHFHLDLAERRSGYRLCQ
jgi:hypothetical protein